MPTSFAVVIPTVNRLGLLREALDSVYGQTLVPAEVIVVVDDPGDSRGIEDAVKRSHPDVRVVIGRGRGDGLARHVGHRHARADWVCFLDDDDLWHREKLARTAEHIGRHSDCGAVRGYLWFFTEAASGPSGRYGLELDFIASSSTDLHHQATRRPPINDFGYLEIYGRSLEMMLERNRGVLPTSAVRKDVLDLLPPPPPDLSAGADWILMADVASHTEWCLIPEGMAFCRLHSGQITASPRIPLDTVKAMRALWDRHGTHAPRPLSTYQREYLARVQEMAWSAMRRSGPAGAFAVLREGAQLLPDPVDRLQLGVPYPLAHRLARRSRSLKAQVFDCDSRPT